ncbi:hypothetical protein PV11_03475 [Exophiala sideris]|uniref:Indoleamine 2,3-dioxygenase n=1 Tax=Exophiala sideris TaxID=1016849 RepID=A0A0D1Z306_9EURO|nr:hypothetical protein PV11_03475 [Exophiala sideris]
MRATPDQVFDRYGISPHQGILPQVPPAEWQRAFSLLGFLTQAYVWSSNPPAEYLPPPIARPFLAVADRLGLPPIATYSGLVLWNFSFKLSGSDSTNPEHLQALTTLTGTKDEEWFYMISVAAEARGGPLVAATLHCMEAMHEHDNPGVISTVRSLGDGIRDLTRLLSRIHEHCNPRVFYEKIRPMLSGTKVPSFGVLSRGVFYDTGDGHGLWRKCSGGSNAQSTLIQLLDIFLGVPHLGRDENPTDTASVASPSATGGFLEEMQSYIPQEHREFLVHIAQSNDLRRYVTKCATNVGVHQAYNNAVKALPSKGSLHLPYGDLRGANLVLTTRTWSPPDGDAAHPELHGTGGTEFMSFLKTTRDDTRHAVIASLEQASELDRLS